MTRRTKNHCAPRDRQRVCRPHLEALEARLPLGDALLGAVLGAWVVAPTLAAPDPANGVPEHVNGMREPANMEHTPTARLPALEVEAARAAFFYSLAPASSPEHPRTITVRTPSRTFANPAEISPWAATPTGWQDGGTALDFLSSLSHFTPSRRMPVSPPGEGSDTSLPIRDDPASAAGSSGAQLVEAPANPAAGPALPPFLGGALDTAEQSHQDDLSVTDNRTASGSGGNGSNSSVAVDGSCTISLVPNKPSPQLVGERIVWTATATNCGDHPIYQFSVGPSGSPLRVVRDFKADNTFAWAPMQEGTYDIRAAVKAGFETTQMTSAVVSYSVNSRVTGTQAVVTPTGNPLVALYSAAPCDAGTVFVNFRPAGGAENAPWMSTDSKPCAPQLSTNFLVAGMLANTTYEMQHVTNRGPSSRQLFTTGTPPESLIFPNFTVRQPPGSGSDPSQNLVLHLAISGDAPHVNVLATDLMGRTEWYYDPVLSGLKTVFGTSLGQPGIVLVQGNSYGNEAPGNDVLREIDLAGNSLRETNLDAVNAQLRARGQQSTYGFHHEALRLPDGKTAVFAFTLRTVQVNGRSIDYVGDMVIVLDENFQVMWTWDAFDHLDVNRGPTLGESCGGGCFNPPRDAVDWLHSNSIAWSPADRNLILSIRHQDWVIKINYGGGSGDGRVLWRLGKDGDFTINSSDPSPWFSHQHNAHYIGATTLVLFDNGNTRCNGVEDCHSRGQVLNLNEQARTVTLLLNADLGNRSDALGAAQSLPNGNFVFTSGFQGDPYPSFGQSIEVLPDGNKAYVLEMAEWEYRSYRMNGLYGQSVNPAATITALTSSTNPSGLSQPVTFSATVRPLPPTTGTVTFREGAAVLGIGPVNASGVATLTTSTLAVGTHSLIASYNGDGDFGSSTSDPLTQGIGSPNERFVAQVYSDLLMRPVEPSGLLTWTGALARGATRTGIVQAIEDSPEYKTLFVQSSYGLYLHRTGEADGVRSWLSFLNSGNSLTKLRQLFVGSPEYFQTRAGGTNSGFLDALYQDALNRGVDPFGRNAWGRILDTDTENGRARVAEGIFSSPESRQTLVQSFYSRFLRRPVDPSGLATFTDALRRNVREQDVIALIVGSDEYFSRIANRT